MLLNLISNDKFFGGARSTSIYEFSKCASVHPCANACVRLRNLVEAELTMTMKNNVVSLNE